MQNFNATTAAPAQQAAVAPGVRELTLGELALVSGGLPRGGWTPEPVPSVAIGAEPLPRGGW